MDDLTPPAFTFCRSSTFAAPALGSLILEHDAHLSTYSPVIVPEGTLVEWIRNGNRFVQDHSIPMTVVGMEGNLKGINNTLDYLYRDSTDPVIKDLCSIAFYGFYDRIRIRDLKGETHMPRHAFANDHPQVTTHCLVRRQYPKVPEANTRVVRIPVDWAADVEDMAARTEEDQQRVNEFALHVLARYYPLLANKVLDLPEAATLYDRVKLWWRQSIMPDPDRIWMLRNLQNLNDSAFGAKPPAHWESDADEEHVMTRVPRPDDDSNEPDTPQPKFKNRLARSDLKRLLSLIRQKFLRHIQPPDLDVYESTTATAFKSYANTHAPAKTAGSTRMPMAIHGRLRREDAEKSTNGKYASWTKAIRSYRVPRLGETGPIAGPTLPSSSAPGTSEPGIHGTVPVSDSTLPAQAQYDNEPSWERLLQPPTQPQAIHLWGLRKMQALAFVKITDPLLKFQRTAAGIPILKLEDQILLLIVGEAGTGKSRVIRAVCWMAHQHRMADWLILTSHQGRPVANLRNPAVRGMTSSVLHKIDPRHGEKPSRTSASRLALTEHFAKLGMVITDEASLTSADHMAVCSKQAILGLGLNRADPDAPFGGLNQVLVFDHLQHTPVKSGSLWYGQASSVAQAWAATIHSKESPTQDRLVNIAAGTAIIRQFHEVIFLDEQIRQDRNLPGAQELHQHLTDIRRNMKVTDNVFDAMNARAIGMPGMPKTISEIEMPIFIVPRHSLIDIINKEVVPARAAEKNKRLIRFYADIVARDNDDEDHRLPKPLLDLARQRPKLGKLQTRLAFAGISQNTCLCK